MTSWIAVPLSPAEADLLGECEVVIERGMGVFIEVGTALMAVRDNKLYRAECSTFEDYCLQRWNLTDSHVNRLIASARVLDELISGPIGPEIIPATESQARELAPLLDDPDELRDVWQHAVERTEGRPTAAAIREVRKERESGLTAKDLRTAEAEMLAATEPSAEEQQDLMERLARQEALHAWNQAHDGLIVALSYAKTWQPPEETDIYVTVEQFVGRINELAEIAAKWRTTNGEQ